MFFVLFCTIPPLSNNEKNFEYWDLTLLVFKKKCVQLSELS